MANKIPTLKEIARRLGFSVSTVSRALHNHPSIGLRTRAQVQQLASEWGYEPNQSALSFKQQKSQTIGVVLPNLKEEFFSQALSGIEDVAILHKYSVLIGQSHDNADQEKQIVATMKNKRVDGMIASISKFTKNIDHFLVLEKLNIPFVFFDRVPIAKNVNKVSFDFNSGTQEAMAFLLKNGYRRIGIINGPEEMKSGKERIKAYMEVLKKKRIKIDLTLVVETDLTETGTGCAMEKLLSLKHPPNAIITMNDWVAIDAINYARKKKIKINKDICFVSYANLPIINYLKFPPIASVEQHPYLQAKKAAEILFEKIYSENIDPETKENFQDILIGGRLVVHKKIN